MEAYSFRIFVGQKNALMLYDTYTIYGGTGTGEGGGNSSLILAGDCLTVPA